MEVLHEQRVTQCENERGVGGRPDRYPARIERLGKVAADRTNIDELHAGATTCVQLVGRRMGTWATHDDLQVLWADTAEAEHHLAVITHVVPRRCIEEQSIKIAAEDMGQQHLTSRCRVGAVRFGVTAE